MEPMQYATPIQRIAAYPGAYALEPPLRALLAQRLSHIASGSADGNDAQSLRHDPLLQRSVERPPLEPAQDVARAPPFARLAHSVAHKDLSRLTHALVDHCIASSPEPPAASVLALDHAADQTHGPQDCAVDHHHDRRDGSGPVCICEGTSHAWVTACLRPGPRPPGRAQARSVGRLLAVRRRHGPRPPLLVRGDSPVATPAGCEGRAQRRGIDGVFGWAGQAGLLRQAAPIR
jgi:hypothetical protein